MRREKLEGEFGEEGLDELNNLGLMHFFVVAVLHWNFGLLGIDDVGVVAVVVRHRRLGLDTD